MRRIIGLLAVAAAVAARATADGVSGDASLGADLYSDGADNAKFREYWYDMHSRLALEPRAAVRWESALGGVDAYANLDLDARTGTSGNSRDGSLGLEAGSYGLFRLNGVYSRIGHNFAYDAKSLFRGTGSGVLTIDDDVQSAIQSGANAVSTLNAAEATADIVNLGLRRDRVTVTLDAMALDPVTAGVRFSAEQRHGTRPYGGTFGFGNAVEIAEPIDYCTLDVSAHVGFSDRVSAAGIPVSAEVTAAHSTFIDDQPFVIYDNPLRLTDSSSGGPATGRNALAPSNTADTLGGDFSIGLPWHVRLSGRASVAVLNQNQTLLPATTNSLLFLQALPRLSAEAQVINSLYEGSLSVDPLSRVGLVFHYRYRQRDNQTPAFDAFQVAVTDTSIDEPDPTSYVSLIERTLEFEQNFAVTQSTRVVTAWENEHDSFINGTASRMNQNRFKLAVDTRPFDWGGVRVSGEHAVRQSDYPNYTLADSELPLMRKYYAADRDRDQVTIMATVTPVEALDVSVEHTQGLDDYNHSQFGLQKDQHRASTVDVSYAAAEGITLTTFFTQEAYLTHQRSRQWSPDGKTPGVGNPFSAAPGVEDPSNWTMDATTTINTVGMATDLALVPGTLSVRVNGTASAANGRLDFASPLPVSSTSLAPSATDNNAFLPENLPQSDETRSLNAGISVRCQVTKTVWAVIGYRYDLWHISDSLRDGYAPVAVTGAGAYSALLTLDSMYKNYEVHTGYVTVGTTF